MNKKRNLIASGLFILASIAGTIGIIIGIKGLASFVDPSTTRLVSFKLTDDVGGLAIGDDVRIGGYKVGQVLAIELVGPHDRRLGNGITVNVTSPATRPTYTTIKPSDEMLLVSISVPMKYDIRAGARVGIQTTVTGQSNLNFDTLGTGISLPENAVLAGHPSAIAELLATVQEIKPRIAGIVTKIDQQTIPAATSFIESLRDQTVPRANAALDEFKGTATATTATVDKIKGHVDPAMAKYHKAGDSAVAMMDEIRSVFGDSKADFRATAANLNAATGSVKERLPGILEKVDAAMVKVNDVVSDTREAMVDIRKSSENIKEATGSARTILATNTGRIDQMIESLKNTGKNLERASADIRHSPWRLLYQPKEAELSNLNLFDSAREFAVGASNLNDAATALRDTLKDSRADDAVIREMMKSLDDRFKKFQDVEKKLWDGVKP